MSFIGSSAAQHEDAYRWYVAHTQPHGEFRAVHHLNNQGFRTFLPLCWKTVRHGRQFRTKEAPFFPRYLFVALAIGRDRWRSVNGTFGVSRLIMEGDRPKPVPLGIVERLITAADSGGVIAMEPTLRPGQAVRIVTGPFADTVGELACLDDCGRVRILLELMGSVVTVSATNAGVVPAGPDRVDA